MSKLVAYYRVSTKKQGQSGLGLEAQKAAVESYAGQLGAKIMREFTEIESGGKTHLDRPRLGWMTMCFSLLKSLMLLRRMRG